MRKRDKERWEEGRDVYQHIFNSHIFLAINFVDRAVWMKTGRQIKILFRLGFRKGVGIKRVEYLSKDTDNIMVRRETEKERER